MQSISLVWNMFPGYIAGRNSYQVRNIPHEVRDIARLSYSFLAQNTLYKCTFHFYITSKGYRL